jgi:3-oxoacyl-[acyl-carrier protein] reductase
VRFEEISVGDTGELEHTLTDDDVRAFAALTGDYNPLHLEPDFARRTLFRRPVVHGMLSASFISTLIGMLLPGRGALWTSQTLNFLHQAYVGDRLVVTARVRRKSPATRALVLDIDVTNQDGQRLIGGESTVKILDVDERSEPAGEGQLGAVLITGGSRGIGAAVARRLAACGYDVVINFAQDGAGADAVAHEIAEAGGRAITARADVADPAAVESLVRSTTAKVGAVRSLIHCAAAGSSLRRFDELPWETIQRQLDIQVRGAYNCVQAILPGMLAEGGGSLVFLGSIAADGAPPAQQMDYVIAKAALTAFARSIAVEYGPKGIRSNIVAPGMTRTDMIAHLPDKAKLLTQMQTPLRRLAEAGDIADAIAFLVGSGARHITGETLRVCGGLVML